MREVELRLALVCYGGASLAVYMNGITAEILNLVRASRNVQEPDHPNRARDQHHLSIGVYEEILKILAPTVKLRVIVDVISGASAGGINGIMLARALAHDLDFAPLKKMWLELGDIEELMDAETISDRWSKIFMVPIMHFFGPKLTGGAFKHPEIKRKVIRFVRSRWFKAPFSGDIMLTWMLEAARDLGDSQTSTSSLLPRGHRLDLFVPVTNFYGQKKVMPLHDPAAISEPRHTLTLKFSHQQAFNSEVQEHSLCDANIPALGFAARATSSFPGAFPSVSFNDLEEKIHKMGMRWGYREKFLKKNFPSEWQNYALIKKMSFVDGGVTNNKPFNAAISAIEGRPAHRRVDRRMVFVDPTPETETSYADHTQPAPGFFKTILGAMTSIPRAEPIYNDLQDIEDHNNRVRERRKILSSISLDAQMYTDEFVTPRKCKTLDVAMLVSWREQSHESARKMTGIAYGPYMELKINQLLDLMRELLVVLYQKQPLELKGLITAWAFEKGISKKTLTAVCENDGQSDDKKSIMARIHMLRTLDVPYRIRRIRYIIKHINDCMAGQISDHDEPIINQLKQSCYDFLDRYNYFLTFAAYEGQAFAETEPVDHAVTILAQHLGLEDIDMEFDEAMADVLTGVQDDNLRFSVVRAYIGFTFYDVMALPFHRSIHHTDQAEVKVDRISPQDCRDILGHEFIGPLMGTELYNFGAFFSRKARENDFLWGRIHAANRLFDFIISAAKETGLPGAFNQEELRRKLLLSILDEEAEDLPHVQELIASLRKKWAASEG